MINYTMFILLDDLLFRSESYRIERLNNHIPYLKGIKYSYEFKEEPLIEIGIHKEDQKIINFTIDMEENTVKMDILDSDEPYDELVLVRPLLDTILVPQEVIPFLYQLRKSRR